MPVNDGDRFTLLVDGVSTFEVECVISPEAIRRGLSGRQELAEGTGMLFLFPELMLHSMWMPEMKFPLDVIWLDEQLSVVHISYGLQPCVSRSSCPSASSVYSTKYAIEVVAGAAVKYGFRVGQDLKVLL
jgi:uncharacterized membrane protein (UPF0127 family)